MVCGSCSRWRLEPGEMPPNSSAVMSLPAHARVVIVGGGIIGCSTAYHLTRMGVRDVLILERKQLTSGTTWHAAGLVRSTLYTQNLTRLAKYTVDLYTRLEPLRKEIEFLESLVIPCSASSLIRGGARCGTRTIARRVTGAACATRATLPMPNGRWSRLSSRPPSAGAVRAR